MDENLPVSTNVSLRDHIAIEAMKVILANHRFRPKREPEDISLVCEGAYIVADEMLRARKIVVDS